MNKNEVLALIGSCKNAIKCALSRKDIQLAQDQIVFLSNLLARIQYIEVEFKGKVAENDINTIKRYHVMFSNLYSQINEINQPTAIMVRPDGAVNERPKDTGGTGYSKSSHSRRVIDVIPEGSQRNYTKKERNKTNNVLRNIFYALGSFAALALIIATIKYYVDHPKDNNLSRGPETTQEATIIMDGQMPFTMLYPIANVNIDDYAELMNYATKIRNALADQSLTIDDIMYAIRMANWDALQDKNYFSDREGVCRSTYNAGLIATALGSDAVVQKNPNTDIFITDNQMMDILMTVTDNNLTLNDFASARVESKGYDIYAVLDRCVTGMYENNLLQITEPTTDDVTNAHSRNMQFAMVFNDVVSRATRNFTIVSSEDAPLSTMYVILGMYNANMPRILELTSGQLLGPIYGNGARIDGNYGDICVEELATACYIARDNGQYAGNSKCIFYTDFIDEVILNSNHMGLN